MPSSKDPSLIISALFMDGKLKDVKAWLKLDKSEA